MANKNLVSSRLLHLLGMSILFVARQSCAQMAADGLPWTTAHDNSVTWRTTCGPTTSAIDCANELVSYACAQNLKINPNYPSFWCTSTTVSCSYFGPNLDNCEITGGIVVHVVTDDIQRRFYTSTQPAVKQDCGCISDRVTDPISPANGNMSSEVRDIPPFPAGGMNGFERFYNSADTDTTDMAVGWRHSFSRQIKAVPLPTPYQPYVPSSRNSGLYAYPADACTSGWSSIRSTSAQWSGTTATYANGVCSLSQNGIVVATIPVLNSIPFQAGIAGPAIGYTAVRDDGREIAFTQNGSTIVPPAGTTLQLTKTATGYQLIDEEGNTEVYDAAGHLLSITGRAGLSTTMSYDSSNRLSTIADNFGHALTLAYNAQNQLISVTDPSSHVVQYGYDSQSRLSTVTNLDSTTVTYVYENPSFPGYLTGVVDESATRFSTWGYNALGQATSSQEAGGAGATTLQYNSDGSVTVTDALGAVRTFLFNIIGNQNHVTAIMGSQCPTCTEGAATTYDGAGFVASRTDYNGNLTCYSNDPARGLELVRVEGFSAGSSCPTGLASYTPTAGTVQRKISTTWSSAFRLPTMITEATRTTSFGYDTFGNLLTKTIKDTTVTPNVSRTWTYTYNGFGQVLTVDGPRTDVPDITTYTYYLCTTGAQCGQIQTITDASGHVWTYNTYNAYGQPLTLTDPNAVLTTLTYDARQRVKSRSTAGETSTFSYYPTGLLKAVTLPDNSSLTYTYDAAHRVTQVTDSSGNKIVYTPDALGNHIAENTYDPNGTLHRTHKRVFNALNELYQDVNAANTAAVTTTYGYDSNGNPASAAAPLSRNTGEIYDALNRLKQITDPGNGVTALTYDPNDNLVSVTDPRNLVTSYGYNGFGDLLTQSSPDTGSTTNTYDSGGNLSTSTDARGVVSTYAYDALNRVASVTYSMGNVTDQVISFTYDSGTNGLGHLTGASDANHSLAWGYDAFGRISSKSQTVNGVTKTVGYAYTAGNLTTLTTPSGQSVTYGYNANHQITSLTVNGTTVLNNVTYEPLGPVNGWTWGNGTTTTRTYNADGAVAQISSNGVKSYSYDNALRITGITDTSIGSTGWTYGYDALDHLTSGTNGAITRGWTYDANGNRLSETGTSASTYTVSPTSNHITGITGALARTYGYDAAGNTTSYSSMTATYSDAGRLRTVSNGSVTETMIYNALGQRIETSGGAAGTVLYWHDEQGHLLGEYDGSGNLIEETVWLGDVPVATLQPGGSGVMIYYVHTDQLNTPRQITRPSDNVQMWTWFSDPFGTDAANSDPAGAGTFSYNLRFPGQVFDGQVGLHSNYFRDFDPALGRYVESDPIGLLGGINTYAYTRNSPLSGTDPFGLVGPGETSIQNQIEIAIATRNAALLEVLLDSQGLSTAEQALARAGLEQIQILSRSTSSTARLAQLFNRSKRLIERAIEQCKQEGLPKSAAKRNPDVVVDTTTGEVYPLTPSGGIGDSIGNLTHYLP